MMAQFWGYGSSTGNSSGPAQMISPRGIRLLADGSGLVVADVDKHCLCVVSLSGVFVQAIGSRERGLHGPCDVLQHHDGSFLVANSGDDTLVRIAGDGSVVKTYDKTDSRNMYRLPSPTSLAALPDGGLVVKENGHFHVYTGLATRLAWIHVCIRAAASAHATTTMTKDVHSSGSKHKKTMKTRSA